MAVKGSDMTQAYYINISYQLGLIKEMIASTPNEAMRRGPEEYATE